MTIPPIRVKRLHPGVQLPIYATPGSINFDIFVDLPPGHQIIVMPGCPQIFGTGLIFDLDPGYGLEIWSRSGHGFKDDVRLANCVGQIDSDYRNEVMVKLTRDVGPGQEPFVVKHGDRIAQARITKIEQVTFCDVHDVSQTLRGIGGLGSTGR